MKNIFAISLYILTNISTVSASGKTSLTGKITDKETKEGISGVSVYFPDLKIGTLSKNDGTYSIDNLPSAKVLVKVGMTGYSSITEIIDLSATTTKDFIMEKSVTVN